MSAAGILVGSPIAGTIINVEQNYFAGGLTFSGSLIAGAALCFAMAWAIMAVGKRREQRNQKIASAEITNGS